MRFETTVGRAVSAQGVGLHSGVSVSITIKPAPAGRGIVFVRTDLNNFEIPANWRFIARVSYATSLMRQGVLISTTEHLLSTLYSLGIDNAVIEIDNLEVPILDGSGMPFVQMVGDAGVRALRRHRRYLSITRPVAVEDKGKRISILPCDAFRLTCEVDYAHPLVGRQELEVVVTPETYTRSLAAARTFGFERDLKQMRDSGLIRGASLDNAVCFNGSKVLNPGGLRFPDECCRHKALDLIGDLALLELPLLGHVVAERAGHAMHTALVSKIMSDSSLYEVTTLNRVASRVTHALVS